jgi:prepilin-type processing-associated H-X9-DG protein
MTYREMDFNSWQEGKNGVSGSASYAMITSRSYHSGAVNVTLADGSVQTISENIDLNTWRALSTRSEGEIVQIND